MKKVLIVESHYRSRVWFKALRAIEEKNKIELFFITTNPNEKKNFLKSGAKPENILDLYGLPKDEHFSLEYLQGYEEKLGISFYEILKMDRRLSICEDLYCKKYIQQILELISSFLEKNKIDLIFTEPTWTHEIIIVYLAKLKKIPVYALATTRIAPDRFLFFRGLSQNEYFKRREKAEINSSIYLNKIIEDVKTEEYRRGLNRSKVNLDKLIVFFRIIYLKYTKSLNYNIQEKISKSIMRKLVSIVRSNYFNLASPFNNISKAIDNKFVLVTLHLQPEASIDVYCNKHSNQIENVRILASQIPYGWYIFVREHPHGLGDRPRIFYEELRKIPGVKLVSPQVDMKFLMSRAGLIFSLTGTASIEASIRGYKSVVATEIFFDELTLGVFKIGKDNLKEYLNGSKLNKNKFEIKKITDEILSNSFEGYPEDEYVIKESGSDKNIRNLMLAFEEVIDSTD